MATDFFQRQAAARRSTAWLLGAFGVSVLATAAAVFVVAYLAVTVQHEGPETGFVSQPIDWQFPTGAAAGTAALIGAGSLYKVAALRAGGGRGVAEGLGGRRLLQDTTSDPSQRRLLNVVEEMAIASGTPTPPVFLLEDDGINAFAAGYSPSDAVIGVTRGCVETLSRDELQGVVAHEFSHILNGDMRMSIRLIGVLHGLLLLGLVGRLVLRAIFHSGGHYDSRRSGSDGSGKGGAGVLAVLAIGAALVVIGAIGSLAGGLIKAAVSRQREYLADASAVQFTRNPSGIAGALKRILASARRGRIRHPRAAELSHMYFVTGVWEGFTSLMATHPPLPRRIRAIEPSWDGALPDASHRTARVALDSAMGLAGPGYDSDEYTAEEVGRAVDQIGDPLEEHQRYAAALVKDIPAAVRSAIGEPMGARAVVYGLLMDRNVAVRKNQYAALAETADPAVVRLLAERLQGPIDNLQPRMRLPLIDMALPSLAAMSYPQYQRFCRSFRALVVADERLDLFEWVLSQVLLRHLRPKFERVTSPRLVRRPLASYGRECQVLLSALAHACGSPGHVDAAYATGKALLPEAAGGVAPPQECGLDAVREALDALARIDERLRQRVIDAAAAVICADRHVTVAEAELLRGVSDLLDCPMPPLLPGQRVVAR
ncbi:M48 family metallopeptidase [Botrimarina sp.]|uniref:M48 family metallopeptidase n=1 Tax=Botrimarina sp. TaxID=2795802 RepID=UPI0032EDA1EE